MNSLWAESGTTVDTTPGGGMIRFRFPAQEPHAAHRDRHTPPSTCSPQTVARPRLTENPGLPILPHLQVPHYQLSSGRAVALQQKAPVGAPKTQAHVPSLPTVLDCVCTHSTGTHHPHPLLIFQATTPHPSLPPDI